MPDIDPAVRDRAYDAALAHATEYVTPDLLRQVADDVLDAAAPLLAEACAVKILAHMEARGPASGSGYNQPLRAWRRHMGIAARVAARSFSTRDEELQQAAAAIARGDFVQCPAPEESP